MTVTITVGDHYSLEFNSVVSFTSKDAFYNIEIPDIDKSEIPVSLRKHWEFTSKTLRLPKNIVKYFKID